MIIDAVELSTIMIVTARGYEATRLSMRYSRFRLS